MSKQRRIMKSHQRLDDVVLPCVPVWFLVTGIIDLVDSGAKNKTYTLNLWNALYQEYFAL